MYRAGDLQSYRDVSDAVEGWPLTSIAGREIRLALLLGCMVATASCALPYLHSPSLEKVTATAADALPSEDVALKPFDDQLVNLAAFAHDEDLGVAKYWTGVRDAHFARLVALDQSTRTSHLSDRIRDRLNLLTGGQPYPTDVDPAELLAEKAEYEDLAETQAINYRLVAPDDAKHDLSCAEVVIEVPKETASAYLQTNEPAKWVLAQLANICRKVNDKKRIIDASYAAGSLLGDLRKAANDAQAKTESELSPRAAGLLKQIEEAKTFAEKGSSVEQLRTFSDKVADLLKGASPGLTFLGWSKASDVLDDVLQAHVCSSDVDEATKTEAKCGDIKPTDRAGKVSATWGMAKALAELADAKASQRRAVQWLIAAKAIVAAEKADAKLKVDEAKEAAEAQRTRLKYAQREALFLTQANDSAASTRSDCHAVTVGSPDPHCQFAAYVDAWNEGRVPAQILEYRPIQIERAYSVRRARVIAQKQHAVASAAAATLKGAGAEGLRAELIAQALFDAAVLAGAI